ncbi:MAG: hypothetical protein UE295_07300 [Acutalibacteraceae bacterium]|nr:hypothetical protein [Acutalibacteraceae bacterium]
MRYMKQILSFMIALVIVINCSPFVCATDKIALTVGNIDDAITDIEYGWDGTTYRFPDDILIGVVDGDDVYLIADATISLPTEPTDPIPTEPVTADPTPTEPVPTEPATAYPVLYDLVPTEPATADPVPTEPVTADPTPTEPVTADPIPTEPVTAPPITADDLQAGMEITLKLTNFRLAGDDAYKYEKPIALDGKSVAKDIKIIHKKIIITPKHPYIYYGQSGPSKDKFTETFTSDDPIIEDQIISGDIHEIVATFKIVGHGGVAPDYDVCGAAYDLVLDGDPIAHGGQALNYQVEIPDDLKYKVLEYKTDEVLIPENESGNYLNVNKAKFKAPRGFLISQTNDLDGDWKDEIQVPLEETRTGKHIYYLRNNQKLNAEHYQAISKVKTYEYTSLQTKPDVYKIEINKENDNAILKFLSFGVFGNAKIVVTVHAKGGKVPLDTTIYLGENGTYESKVVTEDKAVSFGDIYTYSAKFEFDVEKDTSVTHNFKAYAQNICGESEKYPKAQTNDKFYDKNGATGTKVNSPVIIDKKKPDANIIEIDGNYNHNSVKAKFTVSDADSGVETIEYFWDKDIPASPEDANYQTDYRKLDINSGNNSTYELIAPWDSLKTVEGNRHSLTLRITDKVGNVRDEGPKFDTVGSDMLSPNIDSIQIQKADENEAGDQTTDINYSADGTFFNDAVNIIVTVNDNEDKDGYYATGVKEVIIDGQPLERVENTNKFILRVDCNTQIDDLSVTVKDGNLLSRTLPATEIADHGPIKSNKLMIEQTRPRIDSGNYESMGYEDDGGRIWFGEGDLGDSITIKFDDTDGSMKSGLKSFSIKDIADENGKNINTPIAFQIYENDIKFSISEFNEGEHNLLVELYDNCGNKDTANIVFFKDIVKPQEGMVSIKSPEVKVMIDSNMWFNGDDEIIFCVDTFDNSSGVKEISLNINESSFVFDDDNITFEEDGKCYVKVSSNDVADVEYTGKEYVVTGFITDFANNTVPVKQLIVYKDFDDPTIEKITVAKKSDALDKILSVLTFGIYSNDILVVKAYTIDSDNDSGIDYATIQYIGLSEPKNMTDEGDGVFLYELPVSDNVFVSYITIKVYDKYGKVNTASPDISNVEGTLSSGKNLVMIETVKPKITPNLPENESVGRDDDQVWYSKNSDITFKFNDRHSGLNNIDFTVNGNDVTKDKNEESLLKSEVVQEATECSDFEEYAFDTDYLTSISGEATDGKYEICATVTDNAGNKDTYTTVYYLDQTSPVIQRVDFAPETADGKTNTSEFIEELEYGYYFKTDFNVTVNVSDAGPSAGLYKVDYKLVTVENGEKKVLNSGSKEIVDGKAKLVIPKGFKGQIYVEAFDCVNRSSGEKTPKAYVVDNSAPDIKITNNVTTDHYDANGNKLYVESNSFTVVITDTVSGINQIGYLQNSERDSFERKTIDIANVAHTLDYDLGDGWIVTGVEANLVTQVTKIFRFPTDNNDVILTFDATDNSLNVTNPVQSEKFTIDKTAPVINVAFRDDDDTDLYYNSNRIADITIIERNFDASLINVAIKNTFGGQPGYAFTENSVNMHTAVIDFGEGDYTFDLTGADMGAHTAVVTFSGGNEKLFYVDKTQPAIDENFSEFINSAENSFKADKTVNIKIVEHNFNPELMNLKIFSKDAGTEHSFEGLKDVTSEYVSLANWDSIDDVHTASFTFVRDAVYYIEITPVDLAANVCEKHSSVIFEIDKTAPVVSMKNGMFVSRDDTEFLDVYPYERKDDAVPTVEFDDFNISFIKYKLSTYIPERTSSNEVIVDPKISTGTIKGNKYTLPEFAKDGVYAVELTAVDIAGNESELNLNTYARMINQDVLAYIMDNSLEKKTGLYSFEYENGQPISKKPSSFKDLKIHVMAKKDTPIDIVLRDANGKEIIANIQCTADNSIYGIGIYDYLLKADFFKENFQDDVDVELILSVNNEDRRIDLGKMHIDNIVPEGNMPEDLTSWHWFFGEDERTFTLSNISELIDESKCKIYDNGKDIPFVYSSENNTITFTLAEGWHNVGMVLVDMAGNTNNIQEQTNIHIGYFWLWIIVTVVALVIITTVCVVIYNRNRRKRELEAV